MMKIKVFPTKQCSFKKCEEPAVVFRKYKGSGGLTECSFFLCITHASITPFDVKEDILIDENLAKVETNV